MYEDALLSDFAVESTPPGVLKESVSASDSSKGLGSASLLHSDSTKKDNIGIAVTAESRMSTAISDPQPAIKNSYPHGMSLLQGLMGQCVAVGNNSGTDSSINTNRQRTLQQGDMNLTKNPTTAWE